ncbi:hypothetical protein ACHAWF_005478, partial [Thalassiosira exigua]
HIHIEAKIEAEANRPCGRQGQERNRRKEAGCMRSDMLLVRPAQTISRHLRGGTRRSSNAAASSNSPDDATAAATAGEFASAEIDDCNRRYRGVLRIRETEAKGRGLFASRPFAPNDLVMSARASAASRVRDSHSVQTGWERHATMDLPAILINHSCDANVGVRDNERGAYDFFAIKDVAEGEELVWDYSQSEWEMSAPFRCACGSDGCRGVLRGFKHDGEHVRRAYGPFYASYLKNSEQLQ